MAISDFRFQISDWNRSANVRRRAGTSILEVMFAILPSRRAGIDKQPPDIELSVVDRLTKALTARGVAVDFPIGLFADKGVAEKHYQVDDLYHDDVHLQFRGHEVYAEHLATVISGGDPKVRSERFPKWLSEATKEPK